MIKRRHIKPYIAKSGEKFYLVSADVRCMKTGKRKQKKRSKVASLSEARRIQAELENEARAELNGAVFYYTWRSWCYRYLDLVEPEYKNSTLANYKTVIKKTETAFQGLMLSEINQSDINDFLFKIKLTSEKRRKKICTSIKRIFERAVEERVITYNPASKIKIKVQDSELKALTSIESQELISKAQSISHEWFPIWVMALFTGMRSSELYALRKNNVDLENKQIKVIEAWTPKDGLTTTKNKKNRIIPISDELLPFLKEVILVSEIDSQYLLPRLEKWTKGRQAEVLRSFCREIGITQVRFHDLRSTFITQMLRSGISSVDVMKIVGHSSLKITDRYVRISGVELRGATDKLPFNIPKRDRIAGVHHINI